MFGGKKPEVMSADPDGLRAAEAKMRAAGIGEAEIATFGHYYELLHTGATGLVREADIEPVPELPSLGDLPRDTAREAQALRCTAIVKLNGGLGTSMGLAAGQGAAAGQGRAVLPRRHRAPDARAAPAPRGPAAAHPHELVLDTGGLARGAGALSGAGRRRPGGLPPGPRAQAAGRRSHAGALAEGPGAGMVPPGPRRPLPVAGHLGTAVAAAATHGYRYAFVSNADNLGAVLDPRILGWMDARGPALRRRAVRPHRGGPQGRPSGALRRDGEARAARDRPDGRGGPGGDAGHHAAIATSTPTASGSTCAPLADLHGAPATTCSACR